HLGILESDLGEPLQVLLVHDTPADAGPSLACIFPLHDNGFPTEEPSERGRRLEFTTRPPYRWLASLAHRVSQGSRRRLAASLEGFLPKSPGLYQDLGISPCGRPLIHAVKQAGFSECPSPPRSRGGTERRGGRFGRDRAAGGADRQRGPGAGILRDCP